MTYMCITQDLKKFHSHKNVNSTIMCGLFQHIKLFDIDSVILEIAVMTTIARHKDMAPII